MFNVEPRSNAVNSDHVFTCSPVEQTTSTLSRLSPRSSSHLHSIDNLSFVSAQSELSPTANSGSHFQDPLPVPAISSCAKDFPSFEPAFSSPRFDPSRGSSLAPVMASSVVAPRRKSDPANIELKHLASPKIVGGINADSVAGPSRTVDEYGLSSRQAHPGGHLEMSPDGRNLTKEDLAVAKWRKWAVAAPVSSPDSNGSVSPSRKSTPTGQPGVFPAGFSPASSPRGPHGTTKNTPRDLAAISRSYSNDSHVSPRASRDKELDSRRASRLEQEGFQIYATETVRALRDVELAIDETAMARTYQIPLQGRRMSTNPRISDSEDNPFIDITSRLGSRRVRPIVIELVQSLGHYIDSVWSVRYPGEVCPWVSTTPQMDRRASIARHLEPEPVWKSRTITAVQEGKALGYVRDPQNMADVKFWEGEVSHGLSDVDEVVGIYKGVGWAFTTALQAGNYGQVQSANVLGEKGKGGNIVRLLNDLEEAIWGEAQPRPTDLSYELPEDYDPFAIITEEELATYGPGGSSLTAFFGSSEGKPAQTSQPVSPVPENLYDQIPLPELHTEGSAGSVVRLSSSPLGSSTPVVSKSDPLGLDAFRIEGKEMTLEEIGKRRHQEWLASRGEAAVAAP